MTASEIRLRFLDYFQLRGHELRPSSSLVPANDPTLLFTNAGMVQFKQVFLGQEEVPYRRAVTAQKCVRAGGKHNDLEEVGRTARHHTFFEMLGNFSFGDYFKRDAIHFGWEFLTRELGLDPDRLYVTVHHTDDEAFELWREVAGVEARRIFRLGDRDNFWQMADTGPCGPCSELHYDLRSEGDRSRPTREEFEELGEQGVFIELWNLVFMQYNRDEEGELHPLPAPSIDTGAGLERLAAVVQGVESNYDTDLFRPLLERVGEVVGRSYEPETREGVAFRVLADHARAVAFLLADGALPSNEGRGYVVRRILRRAVRFAWLLGRREPTLVEVVREVVATMGDAYPELRQRESQVVALTRQEEERFLATIEGGMARFDQIAPGGGEADPGATAVISGEEAFKLYDTFGFPLDLTQLMARERGYEVDEPGFEARLQEQRERSRADRVATGAAEGTQETLEGWVLLETEPTQEWVGWESREVETQLLGFREDGEQAGVLLRHNPFYAEAGGQVADEGRVEGDGWSLRVERVSRVEGYNVVFGPLSGSLRETGGPRKDATGEARDGRAATDPGTLPRVRAAVDREARHDTERNHTATHLLHAALRRVLGEHVTQRGSLVAPDRLRFDFSHPGPLTPEELAQVEDEVNRAIWEDHPVEWEILPYDRAVQRGAMALFGEKYGDEVRVVEIPGVSLELCGGTHLRHTGEAGLLRILRESGVASGVRRIEAVTGPAAFRHLQAAERELEALSHLLKAPRSNLRKRVDQVLREKAELETLLEELRRSGGSGEEVVHEARVSLGEGDEAHYKGIRRRIRDAEDARSFGDSFREEASMSVAAVATETPDGRRALFVFVTDDLVGKGVRAGDLVREIARVVGGRGGGRPHMAQGGVEDGARVDEALRHGATVLQALAGVEA
jgi:alanyl-tRNA synthetase